MKNPWEDIRLADYENHMKLDSVMQLQALNQMMKRQFQYPSKTIMVLGAAGGNGLEHIDRNAVEQVYAVDINAAYLAACEERHPELTGILRPICVDLTDAGCILPHAQLVVANLLVEYIGYECFQKIIGQIAPEYVSCAIQINTDAGFVSDSPYIHVFDNLDLIHHQMEADALTAAMHVIHYGEAYREEMLMPNGKKLVRIDFRPC